MSDAIQFAVLGIGSGMIYALLAQGIIVIHRGSGVLNFSQGSIAMVSAFSFAQFTQEEGWSTPVAFAAAVAVAAAIGAAIYLVLMRPLRHATALSRVIATLGVLLTLQAVAVQVWSAKAKFIDPFLPSDVKTINGISVPVDRPVLVAIGAVLTLVLWAGYKFTKAGLATGAIAENQRAASALGWSPDRVATMNWAIGGALAGVAGVLIAPITGIQPGAMTLLVIPALAAALIGGMSSFALALVGGIAIGVGQALAGNYIDQQGATDTVPFLVIIVLLVLRGRGVPARGEVRERFARLGSGLLVPKVIVPVVGVLVLLIVTVASSAFLDGLTVSLAVATVMLSVVVLTGYAGQLSLAQMVLGGIGAFIAGKLVSSADWPFAAALLAAVVLTVPIGALFGLPALRARGVNLAVVTLGLGVAVQAAVFNNADFTGGSDGTPIGSPSLFGLNVDPIEHPARYALVTLGGFLLAAYVVARVRTSRSGRRLIAVRNNERAAAALGISVVGSKLYAFALAAGIASLGGTLAGFQSQTILYENYSPFQSILVVAFAVVGGIGYILGPIAGSTLYTGGIGSWLTQTLFDGSIDSYLPLIGGIGVLVVLVADPDGLVSLHTRQGQLMARIVPARIRSRCDRSAPSGADPELTRDPTVRPTPQRVDPKVLEVRDLTVRFGGVTAVDSVSFTVEPGKIYGLIGPNGAGKTTVIDAITGFVRPQTGELSLDGQSIVRWPVHQRARAGVSRSFQSLELFEDITLGENLLAASDSRDRGAYLSNLLLPDRRPPSAAMEAAVHEFGLAVDLGERPGNLPYGRRRLAAVARSVAGAPSILLLDEPAAGLGDHETAELARFVRRLADSWGIGILLIEHDMAFVRETCDRIGVLEFGKLIAEGTEEEVRTNPAVVAAYLGDAEPMTPQDASSPTAGRQGSDLEIDGVRS